MPNGRESILNIFVGILPDAETENRVFVANIIDADIDTLGPFGVRRMHMVHRRRQLMAHEFVPRSQHRKSPRKLSKKKSEAERLGSHVENHRHRVGRARKPQILVSSFSEESGRAQPKRYTAHHVE